MSRIVGSWHGECDCGWNGPQRDKKMQARSDYEEHSMTEHGGFSHKGQWPNRPVPVVFDTKSETHHARVDQVGLEASGTRYTIAAVCPDCGWKSRALTDERGSGNYDRLKEIADEHNLDPVLDTKETFKKTADYLNGDPSESSELEHDTKEGE